MAEDRVEYLPLSVEIDGEKVSRGLRLREIERTHVRDMTPALIRDTTHTLKRGASVS